MFEHILGNKDIIKSLITNIEKNNVSHSYLFSGIQGIGKELIAKEFAKNILCHNNELNCDSCESCIKYDSQNHPDYINIKEDGNVIKIEQIREMQKKVYEKPIISQKKIYIIDNADKMTIEAQNCLLKTLEEPPEYAIMILISNNESLLLPTIKSRCMIINFKNLSKLELEEYLDKNYNDLKVSDKIIEASQGSIKRLINLIDKQEEYIKLEEIISQLNKKDIIDVFQLTETLYKSKEEIFEILEYINIILIKKAKEDVRYANCIEIVETTKKRIKQNANYDMSIDNMLFKIWEEVN